MTSDEREKQILSLEKALRDENDDYLDTIYAILGFCSLWFYDSIKHSNKPNVKIFQGRRLSPISSNGIASTYVTPDLGIVISSQKGILGEVKKNFPKTDEERKKEIFDQLLTYDQELVGWPTDNEKLKSHEIALLVHQSACQHAIDYYIEHNKKGKLSFNRPFSIFEFNRSDQRAPYFFFKANYGTINRPDMTVDLHYGVQIPMVALLALYSQSKIYDAEPPVPYLLQLIWEGVFVQLASDNPKFERLKIKQRLELNLTIDEIVDRLYEGFSFKNWHNRYPDRQPKMPKKEWIQNACQFFVDTGEAEWIQKDIKIKIFYQKYKDVLDHFIRSFCESKVDSLLQPELPGFTRKSISLKSPPIK